MEIINCTQGEPEWFQHRCGIPTASMFSTMMAGGKGATRTKYLYEKAGEIITGEPAEGFKGNVHTGRGHEHEPIARALYEAQTGNEVDECGFMLADYKAGYSPDGLVSESGLIEIKSKLPHLQIEILLKDEVPASHKKQVQGGLLISEKEWLDFVIYSPGLPLFVKRCYRDEELIDTIRSQIDKFNDDLNEIVEKIGNMV